MYHIRFHHINLCVPPRRRLSRPSGRFTLHRKEHREVPKVMTTDRVVSRDHKNTKQSQKPQSTIHALHPSDTNIIIFHINRLGVDGRVAFHPRLQTVR